MLFSILIANYNNGKYFKDCYNSIISQTYEDWEAIIVDDRSTDNSIELITSIIKDDFRFKLITNDENKGCGFTKRRCAELGNGEIAGFLDPDDTITSDALAQMIQAHKNHPEVCLVHSSFYYCNELLERTSVFDRAQSVEVNNRFINQHASVTAFSTFKMTFYNLTSGIDPTFLRAVDQDLYLKLSEKGPFHFIDRPLYNYRIHNKGISTSKVDQAFYWYLKVIMRAEERRKVNLEDEVAELLNRTNPRNIEINLANPRYLILAMMKEFKKKPGRFIKKLFLNR
ncbi:MAG: glycosyltransferase family 2 protein [Ginsengibacter sp.]